MPSLRNPILCLSLVATACCLSSCDQPGDDKRGTYTAARHMRTDSHIPQSDDVNSRSSVYAPSQGQESLGGTNVNSSGGGR